MQSERALINERDKKHNKRIMLVALTLSVALTPNINFQFSQKEHSRDLTRFLEIS